MNLRSAGLFGNNADPELNPRLTISKRSEGAALLEAIRKFVRRFVLLSEAQAAVIAV